MAVSRSFPGVGSHKQLVVEVSSQRSGVLAHWARSVVWRAPALVHSGNAELGLSPCPAEALTRRLGAGCGLAGVRPEAALWRAASAPGKGCCLYREPAR